VVLSAVMALGSAIFCAVTAVQVAQNNIEAMEDRQANDAVISWRKRVAQAIDDLAFEVNAYANRDEFYQQMPAPTSEWARLNLTPGRVRGALAQFLVTASDGRIHGRFRDGDVRGAQSSLRDPAPAETLTRLLPTRPHALSGIGIFAGHPALFAAAPVRNNTRPSEPHGMLIGLAYLDSELRERLQSDVWTLHLEPLTTSARSPSILTPSALTPSDGGVGAALAWSPTAIRRDGDLLQISTLLTTHDGALRITLSTNRAASQRIGDRTAIAILVTGLMVALAALLLGTWLGWRWMAPISALAKACREHQNDQQPVQTAPSGLTEADVLSDSLQQLVRRLRLGQDELAHALDRESAANAIHRRFLAQLGQEFGQPVRRIIALCEQMARNGGRLAPEEVAAAKVLGDELEERFQEILGLANLATPKVAGARPLALDAYLNGLADLLRPQAEKNGMTIQIEAPPDAVPIDQALLSPVLVNLCVNALKAGHPGGTVRLRAIRQNERDDTQWTVQDDGPGLPPGLAERLRDAFTRGEILPGIPGIGMGLTLALANVRALGGTMRLVDQTEPGVTIIVHLPGSSGPPAAGTASEWIRRRR